MALFVFIKPCVSMDDFEKVVFSNNEGALNSFCIPVRQFMAELRKWSELSRKGRVVCEYSEMLAYLLTDEAQIIEIKQLLDKWRNSNSFPIAAGVAATLFDAYQSMIFAECNQVDSLVFFSDEVVKFFEKTLEKAEENQTHNLDDYEFDLPGISGDAPKEEEKGPRDSVKKKILDTLTMVKDKAPQISQLKEIDPKAFQAVMKVVESLTQLAQQGLIKVEEESTSSSSSSSESLEKLLEITKPVGTVVDGKIKVTGTDRVSGEKINEHWHQGKAGVKLSQDLGHAIGATKTPTEEGGGNTPAH